MTDISSVLAAKMRFYERAVGESVAFIGPFERTHSFDPEWMAKQGITPEMFGRISFIGGRSLGKTVLSEALTHTVTCTGPGCALCPPVEVEPLDIAARLRALYPDPFDAVAMQAAVRRAI